MKSKVLVINHLREDLGMFEKEFKKIVKEVIKVLNIEDNLSMSVSFVSENSIKKYNREYRGIDKVTDVISFALEDSDIWQSEDREIGDLFICYKRAMKQANEYGHSLKREICFLFTHGLLHLLGYDHMRKDDEKVMFSLQDLILNNLGIVR